MIFSSFEFICVFLPVVFLLYTIIPNLKIRNILLIIASLAFYAYGEPKYILLLLLSSVLNYVFALLIDKSEKANVRKIELAGAVIANLGILGVFKYADFVIGTVNNVVHSNINLLEIALPIGISFFTFQALSYVVDVYRKEVKAKKNYFDILLYISFFPQLIAGPIVKFHDISEALDNRKQSVELVSTGLRRFIIGLSKKIIIANTIGAVADAMFSLETGNINVLTSWLAAVTYMLQLYFDFSGYSDMAIGLGKMFGFEFKENFNFPYTSSNVQDFWRRWHISMSTWFKEYLYIPLGGNRKGTARTCLNKVIVFFCTGLWHGASWTFVVWGLFHGFFLLLEQFVPAIKKLPEFIGKIYTLIVVAIGFMIFRAESFSQAWELIKGCFTGFSVSPESISIVSAQLTPWIIAVLVAGIFFAGPVKMIKQRIDNCATDSKIGKALDTAGYIVSFALLTVCILRLSGTSYNPFLYFRF